MTTQTDSEHGVPVIDLSQPNESLLVEQIAKACSSFGFFQVTNHGIPSKLLQDLRRQEELYFSLDHQTKLQYKRDEKNSRGFFDDELTKQRRDWKVGLDIGVRWSRDWDLDDDDERNACMDGFNRFPSQQELPEFRNVVIRYFQACVELSDRLATLMAKGLILSTKEEEDTAALFLESLRKYHTSFLRMIYYPPCPPDKDADKTAVPPPPFGVSAHRDAGFLTVLDRTTIVIRFNWLLTTTKRNDMIVLSIGSR